MFVKKALFQLSMGSNTPIDCCSLIQSDFGRSRPFPNRILWINSLILCFDFEHSIRSLFPAAILDYKRVISQLHFGYLEAIWGEDSFFKLEQNRSKCRKSNSYFDLKGEIKEPHEDKLIKQLVNWRLLCWTASTGKGCKKVILHQLVS